MGLLDSLQFTPRNDVENGEEDGPQFEQDPTPGETPRPSRRRPAKAAAPAKRAPTSAKTARAVAEDLASLIEMGAAVWGMTDECCAPVLEQQAKPIADAFTAILARNPRLLAKFADTDLVAYSVQAGLLFKAISPVAKTVYRNHVSKAVDDLPEGGVNGAGSIQLASFPSFSGIPRT